MRLVGAEADELTGIAAVEADFAVQDDRSLDEVLAALLYRALERAGKRSPRSRRNIVAVQEEVRDEKHA